ncbi:hypothetical protein [Pseudomonas viridiflava]|uniref:hypothetical protein n=1 Tax=Pseudomonas viridiflava TaxID=33069 RepID=UPI000F01F2A2|nr:hypothetical protein [Pseudomonas viridiflava]QXG35532.1 hypothetical protein KTT61_26420 [Pseudomonas viridiflava]
MPEIKERPILFSAPMVRAILSGQKTVTRREVKKKAALDCLAAGFEPAFLALPGNADLCPYGKVGDQLWVRETWYCDHFEVMHGPYLKPDDLDIGEALNDGTLVYAADGLAPYEQEQPTWKPSIHMPRWACRILLEVTDVRVERLNAISDVQALAEGVQLYTDHAELGNWYHVDGIETYSAEPRKSFELLWSLINGADSWTANPWVWVVEFKRVTP